MTKNYVTIPAGQYVFREGDAGQEMYLIESGSVEILRQQRGAQPMAVLGPGDFFGEMAVLEDQPRFASARIRDDAKLLRVNRSGFSALLQGDIEIAVRIMRKLASRLRRSEHGVGQLTRELTSLKSKLERADLATSQGVLPAIRVLDAAAAPKTLLTLLHASGHQFVITNARDEWLIGRPDPVTGMVPEVNLDDLDAQRTLSRRHAKLLVEGNLVFLREEVGVANGTEVNGQRIRAGVATSLSPGDRLRFGAIDMHIGELPSQET